MTFEQWLAGLFQKDESEVVVVQPIPDFSAP
jgi:hypothetical protein